MYNIGKDFDPIFYPWGSELVTMNVKSLVTAEELFKMGDIGRCELVRGEIVQISPAKYIHGKIAMEIGSLLNDYVKKNKLGVVCAAETGFIVSRNPDTIRAPDAMFISNERLSQQFEPDFFLPFAPDLAVEVISPSDRWVEVEEKLDEYFRSGVRLAWVIEPKTKKIHVYKSPTEVRILSETDSLNGEDVVPGFAIPVSELFN